ncbi:MAG: hypothetical protein ACYDGO_10285 [Smithellaceae bacterium]
MDILEYISTWSVLKWVILVLVAGFIGQFGRMMAEAIIARGRRHRSKQHQLPEDVKKTSDAPSVLPADNPPADLTHTPVGSAEIFDKKTLKTMAKVRKKEAKRKLS